MAGVTVGGTHTLGPAWMAWSELGHVVDNAVHDNPDITGLVVSCHFRHRYRLRSHVAFGRTSTEPATVRRVWRGVRWDGTGNPQAFRVEALVKDVPRSPYVLSAVRGGVICEVSSEMITAGSGMSPAPHSGVASEPAHPANANVRRPGPDRSRRRMAVPESERGVGDAVVVKPFSVSSS